MQTFLVCIGEGVRGTGFLGQGLNGPKTKCTSSVFRCHQMGISTMRSLQRKIKKIDAAYSWLGRNARGMRVPGPGVSCSKTDCKNTVLQTHPLDCGQHEKRAKEIRSFRCSPSLVGQESIFGDRLPEPRTEWPQKIVQRFRAPQASNAL